MPPELPDAPAFIPPHNRPPPTPLSRSELDFSDSNSNKHRQLKRMEIVFTRKRFIHALVFVLVCMSVIRLLRFAITSYSSSPRSSWAGLPKACNSSDSNCGILTFHKRSQSFNPRSKAFKRKELRYVTSIVSERAPCNLLIFGWEPQYRQLAKINAAGTTIFLEEAPEKKRRMRRSNRTRIYKVNYNTRAEEAYALLKHAREDTACTPNAGPLEKSACKLALTLLPKEVYKRKWDVILVDGPSNDRPEAPGRMATIYTSSMIARAGNTTTNVVIHDADRMIEKWFSREFLCEENLVSSKGRFWNFRIMGGEQFNSSKFCSQR